MALKTRILLAVMLGSGSVFLDSTVVNVALPRIGRELPHTLVGVLEGQSYVYNGYLLTLSALLIPAGAAGDLWGRKRTFIAGLLGFGATSALCGLAPNLEALIAFRLLQGAAGALLVPGSLAIIRSSFEGEEQGRAFGLWAAASSATTLLGPLVGGLLVDNLTWRLAFLINLPLVLVAAWSLLAMPETERRPAPIDLVGTVLCAAAVGGLSFGAIYGQQHGWRGPLPYLVIAIGVVALVALPAWLARARHPLVPLELFRFRNFTVTNISTLLIYGALYVYSYFMALFLQGVLGYTAAAAGVAGVPIAIFLTLLSARFGGLAGRLGPRLFMVVGPLVMATGALWLARVPSGSPGWRLSLSRPESLVPSSGYLLDILPSFLVFGLGIAILVAPLTTALMTSVPQANAGVASAVNNALSRVGPQLAGAAIFVAVTAVFNSRLGSAAASPLNAPPPGTPAGLARAANLASTDAFHVAMALTTLLLVAGAVANLAIRNPSSKT